MTTKIFILLLSLFGTIFSTKAVSEYPGADAFPGCVKPEEVRLQKVKVKIDGRYEITPDDLRISGVKNPWMRTGLYVPPGEKVMVTVPKGVKDAGYRIGGFHCKLNPQKIKKLLRAPEIRTWGKLAPGENVVSNEYGGHLYIVFDKAPGKVYTFTVSGAVKSPDFVLGESKAEKWQQEIAASGVPYGEMVCDRIILTMPIATMRKITDPVAVMRYYEDLVVKDMNEYNGLRDNDPNPLHRSPSVPWRLVFDIQVCAGAAHAGYPIAAPLHWADRAIDLEMMRSNDRAWGFYHEIGHNNQTWCWKWGTLGEVSCNFQIFHARTRNKQWPLRVPKYQSYIDQLVKTDIPNKDFDKAPFSHESRIVPFVQLAQEYGWELFRHLSRRSRELTNKEIEAIRKGGDVARRDFFCQTLAEYTKQDMRPFLDAWGIRYSPEVGENMKQYLQQPASFWLTFDQKKFPEYSPL